MFASPWHAIFELIVFDNQLDLDALQLRFGPRLTLDTEGERFDNHDQANALLTRDYREPFVVPTEV